MPGIKIHRQLTGAQAVHPFAFVQGTDPALDPNNFVAAKKAWIDTSQGNLLKIRDDTNTFWISVFNGGIGTADFWSEISYVDDVVAPIGIDYIGTTDSPQINIMPGFVLLDYI